MAYAANRGQSLILLTLRRDAQSADVSKSEWQISESGVRSRIPDSVLVAELRSSDVGASNRTPESELSQSRSRNRSGSVPLGHHTLPLPPSPLTPMCTFTHCCAHTHSGGDPKDDTQTTFLAWQTWDLLRFTIEGFTALCNDFLTRNPGYFLKLIWVNGSVIESLFGRFKYNAGGHLSAVNYRGCVAKLVQ